ncbi:MAG TPA: histidine kinase dimerization/phospho-acceptor domain-containing protein, partial [Labilithrix sp.]|nr:histidine kinase dimerization/phospho-acceptor domain-containing protein [Labilithrix sp.]
MTSPSRTRRRRAFARCYSTKIELHALDVRSNHSGGNDGGAVLRRSAGIPLRVLMVEDSEHDAVLLVRALRRAGYEPDVTRVETREAMEVALRDGSWSLILSDYSLPTFDAPSALSVLKDTGKDIPFIIVSGSVGEEPAIRAMRDGAKDYILKGQLARLGATIERELRESDERRRRRDAERAVVQGNERFRLIVEYSSDFVSILEGDWKIRYQSPAIERVLGYDPSAVVGSSFLDLVHPEDRAVVRQTFGAVVAAPTSTRRVEFRARNCYGTWCPVESICHNRADDPEIRGIIVTTRDMSPNSAEDEALRALLRAELASRTKSSFLAKMSHELRTPLNAIIGFSELMEQGLAGPLSERQHEYVVSVLESGRHLLTLVNDILDLSKVEAGRMDLDREWIQLGAIAETVERGLQSIAIGRGVSLVIAMDEDLPDVFVDPVRMKQVLFNLLSNGLKFTPSGGTVELNAKRAGGVIEMTVSDTGVGIRPEDLPRLFQ